MQEINPVNVLLHDIKATKGHNGHSTPLPQIEDEAEKSRGASPGWRDYFKWERLTMPSGRTIEKGLVLTPTMGLSIILALSGIFGTMYYRMSDTIKTQSETVAKQNELLIRLDQRFIDKATHDDQRFQKIESGFESVYAWQQVTNKEMAKLQIGQVGRR